jgi:septum formation protein
MLSKIHTKKPLILASGSETRKAMLERIDLDFKVVIPNVDEDALKMAFSGLAYDELGMKLAQQKGLEVSSRYPDAYVIAGDQICFFECKIFDKPGTTENCFKHLKTLSGKTHSQNCFAVICHRSQVLWQGKFQALLTMRSLTDSEIDSYIKMENPINACGSYMLEKHGKYLFSDIHGDHDVILGLPLVPILDKLFDYQVISF